MADSDRFGVRAGSHAAKAAELAARPQGVTMGEIFDATGGTRYNLFKRLEANGHHVRRKGAGRSMRIWLRHRDDIGNEIIDDETQPNEISEIAESEIGEGITFALEHDLQRALRSNLDRLESGLVVSDDGKEDAYRDITATDKNGNTVVIELKAGKAGPAAVAQLLTYMGEVASIKQSKSKVRGILVASDFQSRALSAASVVPNLSLKKYRFHFTFEDVQSG